MCIRDNATPGDGVIPTPNREQTVLQHQVQKDVVDVDTHGAKELKWET